MKEIVPKMTRAGVDAFVQVMIIKKLENPKPEPKMIQFAHVVNAFFPEVLDTVKKVYDETADQKEWTKAVNLLLNAKFAERMSYQTKRDIVQGAMTHYFLN